ncbi:MAG: phytanoyl-CoA dioxygenase family protein [Phycisphaeraceae bacterium]|nr:phytanoyl-CoA dioxygenase family protein [Phycisphaeraceae bacterium]
MSKPSSSIEATPDPTAVAPAAEVWTDATPESPEEAATFFQANGFLVLRNVLDESEVAHLREEVDRIAANHEKLDRIREGFGFEANEDGGERRLRKIGGIADHSPAFNHLMRNPRILNLLHHLLGERLNLFRDVVMMKPARVGREKPWHQDSVYWPWRPMQLISVMTALDDATVKNGCMQVIPGTHKQERQHYGDELRLDIDAEEQKKAVYVPLAAGDTLFFHSLLLHASEPNTSEHDRRVAIFAYRPDNLEYIGKGEAPEPIVVSDRH